ncbi:hypothetical protein KC351_g17622 [Hortaea werneckii]|nr:hypothetical protein KC351_g17622 [Hortaea werneckii]
MVHADSSTFSSGVSKSQAYEQVHEQAQALFDGQRNWICNTANAASLLWHAYHALPTPSNQGKVACQTIKFGRGVCGAAAQSGETQLVPDVEQFPGHIACDSESQSEIVVPILRDGKVVAIIDIDCAAKEGFNHDDQRHLEQLAKLLADGCDW